MWPTPNEAETADSQGTAVAGDWGNAASSRNQLTRRDSDNLATLATGFISPKKARDIFCELSRIQHGQCVDLV